MPTHPLSPTAAASAELLTMLGNVQPALEQGSVVLEVEGWCLSDSVLALYSAMVTPCWPELECILLLSTCIHARTIVSGQPTNQ